MASKRTHAELPSVFDYLDHRRYLADWFEAKKRVNKRFSYRVFARLAGQRSPSLLHHVIDGKRNLTPATTAAFVQALGLRQEGADFFGLLVQLDAATEPDARNAIWRRLSASRRFRAARRVDGEAFAYLSHWYYPAIRELAHRHDFQSDPAWVAATLRPTITVPQARSALQALRSLGLLLADDQGRLRPSEASVVTPHEVAWLAVHNYHQGMMARAAEAITRVDPEQRHFGGVTVAVPMALVPTLKAEVASFQERLLDLCDSASEPDAVYQLNLQLFPLSQTPEVP